MKRFIPTFFQGDLPLPSFSRDGFLCVHDEENLVYRKRYNPTEPIYELPVSLHISSCVSSTD